MIGVCRIVAVTVELTEQPIPSVETRVNVLMPAGRFVTVKFPVLLPGPVEGFWVIVPGPVRV